MVSFRERFDGLAVTGGKVAACRFQFLVAFVAPCYIWQCECGTKDVFLKASNESSINKATLS